MENPATSPRSYHETKPRLSLPGDVGLLQSNGGKYSATPHQLKCSASCSAHSSNSSAWTSSFCEKTMGISEGDDDDDLTWSPGSEPRQCRSVDVRSPVGIHPHGSGLYKRKTPDLASISSYDAEGANFYDHFRKSSQAGSEGYCGAIFSEEKSSADGFLARNEAAENGSYARLIHRNGMSPLLAAGDARSLPHHVAGQMPSEGLQEDGMRESKSCEQALRLATNSANSHSRDGMPSHSEFCGEEHQQGEETDMYAAPFVRRLPFDVSEDTGRRFVDTIPQSERDLYQPIERLEDARWHAIERSDLSNHARHYTITHDCSQMPDTQDWAMSSERFQSSNGKIVYSEDLYNDKSHELESQFAPGSYSANDKHSLAAFCSCIHCVSELGRSNLSVVSPSCSSTGFPGSPAITAHDFSYPPSSLCRHDLNLQNHQVVHLPVQKQCCASACAAGPLCVAASSPHQQHWFPSQHIQLSQHFPPQAISRYTDKETKQSFEVPIAPPRSQTRIGKRRPPYPSQGAVPYVLCQHCAQLLQAPACSLSIHASTLKLRCGSCLKVSKFSIQHSRKPPEMAPRSSTGGDDASFQFPVAGKNLSNGKPGFGTESVFAAHEVPNFWSTDSNGSSSPMRRRYGGNKGISNSKAVAPNNILMGNRFNPGDTIADFPGRVGKSSSTTSAVDTHTRMNVPQWDSLEVTRVTGWRPSNCKTEPLWNDQLPANGARNSLYGTVAFMKDEHPSTSGDVRTSAFTEGFEIGISVAPRNELQRQNSRGRIFSTSSPERSDIEQERRSPSFANAVPASPRSPGSPLYKLLGYKTPTDLHHFCPTLSLPENPLYPCSSYSDALYSARVSDASNGSIVKPTLSPNTPDREEISSWNHERSLEVSAAVAGSPELKYQGSVGSAHFNDNVHSGKSSSAMVKTLVKPELAAAKFSTGFLKRSLIGLVEKGAPFSGNSRQKFTVNGHVLSSAAMKRAERLAGKLRPGCYWYDHKAGFWGVSGGPCVGIVPPFIEQFHASMSRDCSQGNTNVLVNGRELRQEDLDRLSRRGLSLETPKSYSISFDGTVIDESTGETLKNLGKLAPTVELRGRGCGMFMAPSRKL